MRSFIFIYLTIHLSTLAFGQAKIACLNNHLAFDAVRYGQDPIKRSFIFQNTGDNNLVIDSVSHYPFYCLVSIRNDTILPNHYGVIDVVCTSKLLVGEKYSGTVTVHSNAENAKEKSLKITQFVYPPNGDTLFSGLGHLTKEDSLRMKALLSTCAQKDNSNQQLKKYTVRRKFKIGNEGDTALKEVVYYNNQSQKVMQENYFFGSNNITYYSYEDGLLIREKRVETGQDSVTIDYYYNASKKLDSTIETCFYLYKQSIYRKEPKKRIYHTKYIYEQHQLTQFVLTSDGQMGSEIHTQVINKPNRKLFVRKISSIDNPNKSRKIRMGEKYNAKGQLVKEWSGTPYAYVTQYYYDEVGRLSKEVYQVGLFHLFKSESFYIYSEEMLNLPNFNIQ